MSSSERLEETPGRSIHRSERPSLRIDSYDEISFPGLWAGAAGVLLFVMLAIVMILYSIARIIGWER